MKNRPMLKGYTDYAKDVQIIAKNGLLFHLAVSNNGGSQFWVQIWDVKASADVGTTDTMPVFEVAVPASPATVAFPFHGEGWQFSRGIYVRAVTATQGSTLISANNAKFTYQYDGPYPLSV